MPRSSQVGSRQAWQPELPSFPPCAVGFRNPWRMSFDRMTGALYVGDVGQDAWEWVDVIVKGGNYGWAFFEGTHTGFRTPPAGFTRIRPIHEYAHGSGTARGNSITGGVVYRGGRLSQLYGAYVFADYVSGNVPYDLNLPFWSDGAQKRRWFSVPDLTSTFGFSSTNPWSLPAGAVWIKHFELELTNGVPESRRRLETRFIVRNAGGVYGVTYRWNDTQTNASLVPESGLENGRVSGQTGGSELRLVKPGSPGLSELLRRISTRGPGQMPPISTSVVDTNAVALMTRWITNDLPAYRTFPEWQATEFADPRAPEAAAQSDPDQDRSINHLEFLLDSPPRSASPAWPVSAREVNGRIQIRFTRVARRGFEVEATSNLLDPGSWVPLNAAENRPYFTAAAVGSVVEDPTPPGDSPRFYRVRVYER